MHLYSSYKYVGVLVDYVSYLHIKYTYTWVCACQLHGHLIYVHAENLSEISPLPCDGCM